MRFLTVLGVLSAVVFITACDDGKKTSKSDKDGLLSDSDTLLSDDDQILTDEETDEATDGVKPDTKPDGDGGYDGDTVTDADVIPSVCGDGTVEGIEVCEKDDVIDCIDIDAQIYQGGKAKCLDDCTGWDTATCDEIPHECGNDIKEGPEACDGDLKNCVEIDAEKYSGGKAACLADCSAYDTATCDVKPGCGNGVIDNGEACEEGDTTPCADLGFDSGTATCKSDCSDWDISSCVSLSCGDDIVDGGELCDGNLGDCVDIDPEKYSGGKAYCNDTCNGWETATCEEIPPCATYWRIVVCTLDGTKDQMETCDAGVWEDWGPCLDRGFYVILPYNAAATTLDLSFLSNFTQVDMFFVQDKSPSMMEELDALKDAVNNSAFDTMLSQIDSPALGLATFSSWDTVPPFGIDQPTTLDTADFKTAVNALAYTDGATEPQAEALYHALDNYGFSGTLESYNGSTWSTLATVSVPAQACSMAAGSVGNACMRQTALPILLFISDEAFVDYTTGNYRWTSGGSVGHDRDDVVGRMNEVGAKFIGIDASGTSYNYLTADFTAISEGTGSVDGSGTTFNKTIASDGTSLGYSVMTAINELMTGLVIDVGSDAVSRPNSQSVDATDFITAINPYTSTPLLTKDADLFHNVGRDATLTFRAQFRNTSFIPTAGPVGFAVDVSAVYGNVVLDTAKIDIIVPE